MARGLRWGIIGCSEIARSVVIPSIINDSAGSVTAVGSRDMSRAAEVAERFSIPSAYGSYTELLDDANVDAVYISVPNAHHVACATSAARAGKAILCEKPLGVTSAEARQLVDFCEERGTPLLEGFMYRFHPQTRLVHQLVAGGAIGALREVDVHLSVDLMRQPHRDNIRFDMDLGGGVLLDMGCYCVDILLGLMGRAPLEVATFLQKDAATGVDIAAAATIDFGEGMWGQMSCSFRAGGQGNYRIIGSDGIIEVPRGIIPGVGDRVAEALVIEVDAQGGRKEHRLAPVNQYALMIDEFSNAVVDGTALPFPASRSVDVLRVLEAIRRSAQGA